jgi:4-amino-4-deoxy-L-arabinose transferase-like glycosyltransferase
LRDRSGTQWLKGLFEPVSNSIPHHRLEFIALLAILFCAAMLRLWQLDGVPPGFTHDEAGHGHDALAILRGARPIYQSVGYGREPLYDYWAAAVMAVFGHAGWALRLASVLAGVATLALSYGWVRLAFDSHLAVAAVLLQAASFWSLSTSRQALRSTLLPALYAAAAFFFWRSIKSTGRRRYGNAGLMAVFLGAALYTYVPARVLWVLFPAFLAYLGLVHRPLFRRAWRPTLLAVAAGLSLAVPLFVYLNRNPNAEQRLGMLSAPLEALGRGDLAPIVNNGWRVVAGLLLPGHGDDFLAYNIPGRPMLAWPMAILFLVGVGLCLVRWRRPAAMFALLWLLVGISPALVTGVSASSTRSIGVMPVLFVFPAWAFTAGARWFGKRRGALSMQVLTLGFAVLGVGIGASAARSYFQVWAASPDVRAAYQHNVVEMARYLQRGPRTRDLAVSSVYPEAPHDPYVFELLSGDDDRPLRWFDGRYALLLPNTERVRLFVPSSALLNGYFRDLPGLHLQEEVTLRSDDLDPYFLVYDWAPGETLRALRARTSGKPRDFTAPVDFGGALQWLGYDLRATSTATEVSLELVGLWEVTDPRSVQPQDPADVDAGLVFFTHVLDGAGTLVAQADQLNAPIWDWQAGDVIAQVHRIPLPDGVEPGAITLAVGAYRRSDMTRLPVVVEGAVVADHIVLPPLEVALP